MAVQQALACYGTIERALVCWYVRMSHEFTQVNISPCFRRAIVLSTCDLAVCRYLNFVGVVQEASSSPGVRPSTLFSLLQHGVFRVICYRWTINSRWLDSTRAGERGARCGGADVRHPRGQGLHRRRERVVHGRRQRG